MTSPNPFIPAEAGTQCFGYRASDLGCINTATVQTVAQTWVPASAGMSGI